MHWLLEPDLFAGSADLAAAARTRGHRVTWWDDAWWDRPRLPTLHGPTLFRGCLDTAHRLATADRPVPGAWCHTPAFRCSQWYPHVQDRLVHRQWTRTTVRALVAAPPTDAEQVFVRPDSPLKPFSGRVVSTWGLTAAHLDHGFYYDDLDLSVIVAPVQELGAEWRFVVCDGVVVAGSAYDPARHRPAGAVSSGPAHQLAAEVARALPAPDPGYILDIVETATGLRVLELNPFSGADLYDCPVEPVIDAVSAILEPSTYSSERAPADSSES